MKLHEAAKHGDIAALAAALDGGMDIDAQDHNGQPPLLTALFHGHNEVARMLLDRGADPTVRNLGGSNAHNMAFDAPEIRALLEQRGDIGDLPALINAAADRLDERGESPTDDLQELLNLEPYDDDDE